MKIIDVITSGLLLILKVLKILNFRKIYNPAHSPSDTYYLHIFGLRTSDVYRETSVELINLFPVTNLRPRADSMHLVRMRRHYCNMFETHGIIGQTPSWTLSCLLRFRRWKNYQVWRSNNGVSLLASFFIDSVCKIAYFISSILPSNRSDKSFAEALL